jgi:spore coat polysaccharide biosynthesis predicted glycosyltransferase SpsG
VCAENQWANARFLADSGAVLSLGWHADILPREIADALLMIDRQPALRRSIAENAASICDGEGAARVASAIDARFTAQKTL